MVGSILRVSKISKRYGAVIALDQVSTDFYGGEVHALLGENGAGKSTMMGILAGLVTPDSGEMTLDSEPLPFGAPQKYRSFGIGMVHQHFTLVPEFTVAENLALSQLSNLNGVLDTENLISEVVRTSKALGWALPLDTKIKDLSVGARQRVEILKAVAKGGRVLVLDEPTAVLAPEEIEDLFTVLRRLADEGKIVILIAHKLKEVRQIADRVTVLRRGLCSGREVLKEITDEQLAVWMVGEIPPILSISESHVGAEVVVAQDIQVFPERQSNKGASLTVHKGEILGLGGVDGNGQVELAELLVGIRPIERGSLSVKAQNIGYISQDRQNEGLALGLSIEENLILQNSLPSSVMAGPLLSRKRLKDHASRLIEQFQIKVGTEKDSVRTLSGGNQQKVVVARELEAEPEFIVAMNPTRGLDIRSTRFVRQQLLDAKARGAAILLITADLDELHELSDRILYLNSGELSEKLVGGLI